MDCENLNYFAFPAMTLEEKFIFRWCDVNAIVHCSFNTIAIQYFILKLPTKTTTDISFLNASLALFNWTSVTHLKIELTFERSDLQPTWLSAHTATHWDSGCVPIVWVLFEFGITDVSTAWEFVILYGKSKRLCAVHRVGPCRARLRWVDSR